MIARTRAVYDDVLAERNRAGRGLAPALRVDIDAETEALDERDVLVDRPARRSRGARHVASCAPACEPTPQGCEVMREDERIS